MIRQADSLLAGHQPSAPFGSIVLRLTTLEKAWVKKQFERTVEKERRHSTFVTSDLAPYIESLHIPSLKDRNKWGIILTRNKSTLYLYLT